MKIMEVESLKEKRRLLINELHGLKKTAVGLGITGNRAYYQRGSITQEQWDAYKSNSSQILDIESQIRELNNTIYKDNKTETQRFEILRDIIKDSSPGDWGIILAEFKRREAGSPPMKVTLKKNDNTLLFGRIKELKKTIAELVDNLIIARENLNKYISENEPEINKGDFLKKVSILNKSIRSVKELRAIKINQNEKY